ncbi:MAG TPA: hypothetical protein DCZ94_14260, partial [Lentisphaeria bacterium]|nr:hypothetical protein [Lentisphaeria bacterium]
PLKMKTNLIFFQVPSSKSQIPNKFQIPIFKQRTIPRTPEQGLRKKHKLKLGLQRMRQFLLEYKL